MLISQIFAIGAILLHSVVAIPLAATKDATPEVQLSQRSTHRTDWPRAPHRRSVNSPQHERRLFNPLTPTKAVFRKVFGKGKEGKAKESKTKPKPKPPQAAAPRPLRTYSSHSIKRGLSKDSSRREVAQHERRLIHPLTSSKAAFRKVFGKGKKTKTKPKPPQAAAPKPIPEWQKPYKPPPSYNYYEPLPVPKPMPPAANGYTPYKPPATYSYYEPLPVPKPMPPAANGYTPYKPPPTYSYDNFKRQLSRRSSRSKVASRSKKAHLL